MNHIALHILQPVPTSCLNRDDVGAPKNVIFGGVTRARVSSQCWKRAIRLLARSKEFAETYKLPRFVSRRTARVAGEIQSFLTEKHKLDAKLLGEPLARSAAHYLATIDPKDEREAKTMMLFSPTEYEIIADVLAGLKPAERDSIVEGYDRLDRKALETEAADGETEEEKEEETTKQRRRKEGPKPLKPKEFFKLLKSVLKVPLEKKFQAGLPRDAADVAIFGRMIANDPSFNIEGSGLFAHALSTHKCDNDLDFWTAVDDLKDRSEGAGADNMSHAEFTAACYYRYVGLNLDQLFYQKNEEGKATANLRSLLKPEDLEFRRNIVRSFIRTVLLAVPSANKTGKNADCFPEFALGLLSTGQPFQLVNAFESPVRANGHGWLQPSVQALETHFTKIKKVFGLQNLIREEVRLSEGTPLDQFIERLVIHVN